MNIELGARSNRNISKAKLYMDPVRSLRSLAKLVHYMTKLFLLLVLMIFFAILGIFIIFTIGDSLKWNICFLKVRSKFGNKIKGRLLHLDPWPIRFKYLDADIEIFPPSRIHGVPFPMNMRLVSSKFIFTPEIKEISKKHGNFNIECDMRYLKLFSKGIGSCRDFDEMVDVGLTIYEYALKVSNK